MLRMFVIVVCGLVAAIAAALAAMIVFGTGESKPPLASVDFSDLPAVESIPARSGTSIAFRLWRRTRPGPSPRWS